MGSPDPPGFRTCARQSFFDNQLSPTRLFQRLPRGGHTRSLSEHGSQAPHRRWYLAHGPGRVGRRWILEAPCPVGRGPLRFWRPFRLRLHSRDHARSIPGTCRSRPLDGKPSRGLFRFIRIRPYEFYIHPRHLTARGTLLFLYRFCKSLAPLRRGSRHPWRAFRFFFISLLTIWLR